MKTKTNLGSYATVSLLIIIIITKALISTPSLYARHSLGAGWLEVLISGIFEIFILAIVIRCLSEFELMDIIDISEKIFGKLGKVVVGIASCVVFTVSSAAVFRSFAEMIRNTVMRGASYESIAFFLLAAGLVAANLGIRTQSNLTGLILPLLIFAIIAVMFINYSRMSIVNIQPIFGVGFTDVLKNALLRNASFFEIGVILYLAPYMNSQKAVKQISFTALGASVAVTSIITLFYQLSVPYEAAGSFALPLYQMTRMLKAGTFFQRIEPLNLFIWGGAVFVYVALGIWLSAKIYKKTFDLSDHKPLVYIFGLIICVLSLIPGSETSVERIFDFLMTYSYIAYPLVPLCLLTVACVLKNTLYKEKGYD